MTHCRCRGELSCESRCRGPGPDPRTAAGGYPGFQQHRVRRPLRRRDGHVRLLRRRREPEGLRRSCSPVPERAPRWRSRRRASRPSRRPTSPTPWPPGWPTAGQAGRGADRHRGSTDLHHQGPARAARRYVTKDQAVVDTYFADIARILRTFLQSTPRPTARPSSCRAVRRQSLYLNTKVWHDAGVELPTDAWTWDDFTGGRKAVKEKTGAFVLPAGTGYFTDVMPWLTTNGACTLNEDWTQATFNSPAAVESATFARAWSVDGLAPSPAVPSTHRPVQPGQAGRPRRRTVADAGHAAAEGRRAVADGAVADEGEARVARGLGRLAHHQGVDAEGPRLDVHQVPDLETFGDASTSPASAGPSSRLGCRSPPVPLHRRRSEGHGAVKAICWTGDPDPQPEPGRGGPEGDRGDLGPGHRAGREEPQTALAEADTKLQSLLS